MYDLYSHNTKRKIYICCKSL